MHYPLSEVRSHKDRASTELRFYLQPKVLYCERRRQKILVMGFKSYERILKFLSAIYECYVCTKIQSTLRPTHEFLFTYSMSHYHITCHVHPWVSVEVFSFSFFPSFTELASVQSDTFLESPQFLYFQGISQNKTIHQTYYCRE